MINYFISDISYKVEILTDDGVMNKFNGVYIYHTRLYLNINCDDYIKLVLERLGLNGVVKKHNFIESIHHDSTKKLKFNTFP